MFRWTEDNARLVDTVAKLLTTLGLLVGGAWTVYTFLNTREHEAKTATLEARKPFEAKRLELYVELCSVAATATSGKHTKAEIEKAKQQLIFLFWGPISLIGDKNVLDATAQLGECLANEADCRGHDPKELAAKLSDACRSSIAGGWDVYLPANAITKFRLEQLRFLKEGGRK